MVKIASDQMDGMTNGLVKIYGMSQPIAHHLVSTGGNAVNWGGEITGAELYYRFSDLKALTANCEKNGKTDGRCVSSIGRSFFDTIDRDLKAAAKMDQTEGKDNDWIDSDAEVSAFLSFAQASIVTYFGVDETKRVEEEFGFNSSNDARTLLTKFQTKYSAKGSVDKIMEFDLDGFRAKLAEEDDPSIPILIAKRKNSGLPNTLVAAMYVPSTDGVPINPKNGFDFLVEEMDQYDDRSQVFLNLYTKGAASFTGESGAHVNHHVMDLAGTNYTAFDANVYWFKEGDAFATRFSMIPGTQASAKGTGLRPRMDATALEGKLTVIPVADGGLYVSLEMDFDLRKAPDVLLNALMGGTIRGFANDLMQAYVVKVTA